MVKKRQIPHTYVIVFYIIILAAILTWVFPGGEYFKKDITQNGIQKSEMTFRYVNSQPQTWQVFSAIFKGFERQSGIIVFILMIGGAFWIMNESKAMDVGIDAFLRFTKRVDKYKFFQYIGVEYIIMVMIMVLFSIFGAVFGMSEETIAFIIILVPLAISMGFDSITGVGLVFVAAGLGFAGAVLNPFTIGIAQGLSNLPLFSGFEYRLFCWLVINVVGITYVIRYARKVRKNPSKSPVYQEDEYWRNRGEVHDLSKIDYYTPVSAWISYAIISIAIIVFAFIYPETNMKIGNSSKNLPMLPFSAGLFIIVGFLSLRKSVHFFILTLLGSTILFLIIGVMGYQWYIMRIATLFFTMGIFSGIAMNYSPNKITFSFLNGVKDILSAALIVGLAGGIIVILEDGKVIDTILYKLSGSMEGFGKVTTVSIMYFIQTVINIVIPSGSAKAALTMPIMAPFSDLIGLSRQATVMAFQFGDGFTNMITPTSGVLIGVLGVARIPYEKWVKWVFPFMVILMILGLLLLIPTVTMQLNGF
ncbi:MAG: YfcC family protein [Chlorobi bacterium]|nr:YfcC family protein [Chlorobiota bacterium]